MTTPAQPSIPRHAPSPLQKSSTWPTKKLGDLIEKIETLDPRKTPAQSFRYIDVSSVSNISFQVTDSQAILGENAPSRARRVVRENDVIFATIRPTLKRMALISKAYDLQICSTGYFVFRPKKELLSSFIFYFLRSDEFMARMESLQKGASYPAVTDREIRLQPIPVPPLAEQKRIVAILDEAFEGLATAHTQQKLQNAQELFQSTLQSTFQEKGDGWVEMTLDSLCHIKHGFPFKSSFFTTGGNHVVLTPGNFFEKGGYRDRGAKTKFYAGKIPKDYILSKNDFLIAMTEQAVGLLGSSLIVPDSNYFLHNQRLGLVQLNKDVIWNNRFFFHQFNTKKFRSAVQDSASGVKVRHTSSSKLGAIKVQVPPLPHQQTIVKKLDALSTETRRLESLYRRQLAAYAELKQSLLNQAFSGKL